LEKPTDALSQLAGRFRRESQWRSPKKPPSADTKHVADFTKEQELSAYRSMLSIRRFEEKAGQMYGMG
jgi:TPP-dependent pyruvate/acetoin dehydrogenase alpha subunit